MVNPRSTSIAGASCVILLASASAFAAQALFIDSPAGDSNARRQTEVAAKFYGVQLDVAVVSSAADAAAALELVHGESSIVGVVIAADALSVLRRQETLAVIRGHARPTPLLITGITERTDPIALREWSRGAITACSRSGMGSRERSYVVSTDTSVAQELSGATLPFTQSQIRYLIFGADSRAEWLLAAKSSGAILPVFARTGIGSEKVFFATAAEPAERLGTPDPDDQLNVFGNVASEIMFFRYVFGSRGWHAPGRYANLTIDDAWLREPYGHINYESLLNEMTQHNFHTTVAFVPWNFDRSESSVVSLFRAHPDRFSICIHGNNHDHREFGPYTTRPLNQQTADIIQALARMAEFTRLTGVPFDPIMVFPHAVAPERTFSVLKRYNFWATANSLKVPLDAFPPSDPEFALHTATMAFDHFPSLRRYSAEIPIQEAELAVDAFLGNPMLFYVHESAFATGISAFNRIADLVNRLQPNTQWCGLGEIAQHLYVERQRADGAYDIRAYSPSIHLDNHHKRDAIFFVEREEDFVLPLTVLVNGHDYPYERNKGHLCLQLCLRPQESATILIRYTNKFNLASIDIGRKSFRVAAIRYLSDFRDNVVSRSTLGRRFIRSYIGSRTAWDAAAVASMGILLTAMFISRRRRIKVTLACPKRQV